VHEEKVWAGIENVVSEDLKVATECVTKVSNSFVLTSVALVGQFDPNWWNAVLCNGNVEYSPEFDRRRLNELTKETFACRPEVEKALLEDLKGLPYPGLDYSFLAVSGCLLTFGPLMCTGNSSHVNLSFLFVICPGKTH
jgi:hypothetical protein